MAHHFFSKFFIYVSFFFYPVLISGTVTAQQYTSDELLTGYKHKLDTTYFIFSPSEYGLNSIPDRVVVTGKFREWNQDMENKQWHLKQQQDLWILKIYNSDFEKIPPSSPFKFRIDDGTWLNPPAEAPNAEGGNLVFMHEIQPPSLKAEFRDPFTIWAHIGGLDRSFETADYIMTTAEGSEIELAGILPNTATETLISTQKPINIDQVHYLSIPSENLKTAVSFDGWFRRLYSDKTLGATIAEKGSGTTFRLFAPRADNVRLMLYETADGIAVDSANMQMDVNGVWEAHFDVNMKGTWYDYKVFGPDEPGTHYYNDIKETVSDPYARVNDDAWGRSRVWPATQPPSPLPEGIPAMENIIAYEVHVQDFTDRLPVKEAWQGTFRAMIEPGLTNSHGASIGFDYLTDLGVNVVHLMPVQEFLHYPDEEWKNAFEDDPFMQKHGIATENYQWGYRTTHAFAVENRYRTKGSEHGAERKQFRQLVEAFHDKGMAVIIDIVPNHTGENMDGVNYYFNFNGIDKTYYYRTENFEHIGAYGNEVKTENRPMVQRWLIDQCLHFINEFGVDGFRIDLAGQIDEQTLIALKKAIGEDKILYGEPWIASADPDYENNPDWDWYKVDSPITFFQDDARNAFKGSAFFDPNNPEKKRERGYAGGNTDERERVMLALQNHFPEEDTPLDGINYLDIHDNWALADQFAKEDWDGRKGVLEDRFKIAALLLFTSQGPIVLHGGTEMMRSKAHAKLKETVKETGKDLKVYLHGKRDTYNMRKANQFNWENVGLSKGEQGSPNDYVGMVEFWKNLIDLRLSDTGDIFRNADKVSEDYYQFIAPDNRELLGYVVDEKVAVLINTGDKKNTFRNFSLPAGIWHLSGSLDGLNPNGISSPKASIPKTLTGGGKKADIPINATSFYVWIKE